MGLQNYCFFMTYANFWTKKIKIIVFYGDFSVIWRKKSKKFVQLKKKM